MALSDAVDSTAVARVLGIKTTFVDFRVDTVLFLPIMIPVVGQGASSVTYSSTKRRVFSEVEAGETYGFGSPIHLAVQQLLPQNNDGVGSIPVTIYPLQDDGSGVASTGDITPTGTATSTASYVVRVNNIDSAAFVVTDGELGTVLEDRITDAINAVVGMPLIAVADGGGNKSDLTSKWKGTSANQLKVSVIGEFNGITFGVTAMSGGLVNPDVQPALDQVGDVWETFFLNCMEATDTSTLDKFFTFGEGRWLPLVRKPMVAFVGTTEVSPVTAIAITDTRKTDRINVQMPEPGSDDLPFVVAARLLARIAPVANNKPANDYAGGRATGLTPGTDQEQWTFIQRDAAIKGGSSTIEVIDGVVEVSDTVTMYHPTGEIPPAFRFVKDLVKLWTAIFNIDVKFASDKWKGKPLIPDTQITVNPDARKPKDAVADIGVILDGLGLQAIISDPTTAKKNTVAEIDGTNPNRLNMKVPIQLSGNTNIISIDLDFGFFFGTAQVIG